MPTRREFMTDEVHRECPRCGRVEPISSDVVEDMLDQGYPDSWLCWRCAIEANLAIPEQVR